jgi:hypothetical protein
LDASLVAIAAGFAGVSLGMSVVSLIAAFRALDSNRKATGRFDVAGGPVTDPHRVLSTSMVSGAAEQRQTTDAHRLTPVVDLSTLPLAAPGPTVDEMCRAEEERRKACDAAIITQIFEDNLRLQEQLSTMGIEQELREENP